MSKSAAEFLLTSPKSAAQHLVWGTMLFGFIATPLQLYFGASEADSAVLAVLVSIGTAMRFAMRRRLKKFKVGDLGIVVLMKPQGTLADTPEVRAILASLVAHLTEAANSVSMSGSNSRIRVVTLPDHIAIQTKDDATRLLEHVRGVYAIWASPSAGRSKGESAVDLGRVNFVVRHVTIEGNRYARFVNYLQEVHQYFPGHRVRLEHEIEDTRLVADNLGTIARYQLGLAAAANGWRRQAIELLSGVSDGPARFHKIAKSELAALLINYWLPVPAWPTPTTSPITTQQAVTDARAGLALNPRAAAGHAILASCLFLQGHLAEASYHNDLLKPFDENAWRMNRAVFAQGRRDFDEAFRLYERAYRRGFTPDDSRRIPLADGCVRWLCDAAEVYGPEYSFGVAYLNDRVRDVELAKHHYREVLPLLTPGIALSFVRQRLAELEQQAA